jgi:hypothetical protein
VPEVSGGANYNDSETVSRSLAFGIMGNYPKVEGVGGYAKGKRLIVFG